MASCYFCGTPPPPLTLPQSVTPPLLKRTEVRCSSVSKPLSLPALMQRSAHEEELYPNHSSVGSSPLSKFRALAHELKAKILSSLSN